MSLSLTLNKCNNSTIRVTFRGKCSEMVVVFDTEFCFSFPLCPQLPVWMRQSRRHSIGQMMMALLLWDGQLRTERDGDTEKGCQEPAVQQKTYLRWNNCNSNFKIMLARNTFHCVTAACFVFTVAFQQVFFHFLASGCNPSSLASSGPGSWFSPRQRRIERHDSSSSCLPQPLQPRPSWCPFS